MLVFITLNTSYKNNNPVSIDRNDNDEDLFLDDLDIDELNIKSLILKKHKNKAALKLK